MRVGIERLNLYVGQLFLNLEDLALARRIDPEYLHSELMCDERSIIPPWEDAVTLAVNAALLVLDDAIRAEIELVIVATESGIDDGKPISNWVQRYCELPSNCRSFEVKHACYGCTAALKMAASWVASGTRQGKKALVVNTDLSRPGIGSPIEHLGGGSAVAMIVGDEPEILEIDLEHAGYWTHEIDDNLRPAPGIEIVAELLSVYSYLDALDGAYDHFERVSGPIDYTERFARHIYHAPFPGMTLQAHRAMMSRFGHNRNHGVQSFKERVEPGLTFARRLGSSYGSSNYVSLLGHMHDLHRLIPGDHISFFSYGGGCQGEFWHGTVGRAARTFSSDSIAARLDARMRLSMDQYETLEGNRAELGGLPSYIPNRADPTGVYEGRYAGQHLLVLEGVKDYIRAYGWS
ncbi:MAG TPA: hydroxymethylglutaryl-CoA synthase [Chloroflexota bacterium]|jgi:hydroxymethylglutaryl-CoA synthase